MTQALATRSPAPVTGRRRRRPDVLPYLMVTPVTLFIVGLALVPAGSATIQAFFVVDALDPPVRWAGLGNFVELAGDPQIRAGVVNTIGYVAIGVIGSTVLAIAAAVLLQRRFRGRSLVIAVMILPWALPGVVEGILWQGIFQPGSGLVSGVLSLVGPDGSVLLGQNRPITVALIELVQIWQIMPLSALLILAALQLIPDDLYEAAALDGCSPWAAFRSITMPLARPGIAVAMVQAVIATLNVFDQPYVLNGSASTAASVTMQTYFVSFQNLDFGAGYALTLATTVVTLVLSALVVRVVYRRVEL